ncbi:MAG: efflux RND transporter permease subunit [bacterium]|nr:efflux RND transporter permease subunit [bacterium]
MKITNIAVNRSMTMFALMVLVIFLGATSYSILPRESSPDVKIPYVIVAAPYFGTSPSDMENLVTRKLEQQLKGVADLKEMISTSAEGMTQISLEFDSDVEMSDALQKVRDAVEMAKPELPQDVKDDLVIQELSSTDWPIMQIVLSADYDPIQLKNVAENLQEEIERVEGVLAANMNGHVEREVQLDIDPRKLHYYGMALVDVMDAVALENITFPGGNLAMGTYDYQVRVPGEFETIEEIANLLLNPGAPDPIYMRDVASITLGIKDRETISRLNSIDAVTLSITKRSGENIIRIADEIKMIVAEFEGAVPAGTSITVTGDQSISIEDVVRELENNILSGLILVVAVLFMFLGVTNSFFIASAIPFSMLMSFIVLRFMGYTLNMVVLFSLILALGMLVDNAIVVVENIFRHRAQGMSKIEAAKKATHQVSAPIIASTMTTLCVFGPLVFWPGIMGEFMKYLPVTVMITLVSSLVVAMIFNPVLCSNFMKVPDTKKMKRRLGNTLLQKGLNIYEPILRWSLRHRLLTMGGMFLLLFVMIALFGRFNAGVELFPDVEPTYAYVNVNGPSGMRIEMTDSYAETIEREVAQLPELKSYVADVGRPTGGGLFGGGGGTPSHQGVISMEFVKSEDRKLSSFDALTSLRESLSAFTGARLTIDKQDEGPPTGPPVSIEISGDDFLTLGELAARIKEIIRDIPGLVDLEDDYDTGRPEIRVKPNLEKAARLGLRTMDLASNIRTAVHGSDVSKFRQGEDEFDIVVRLKGDSRESVEDLEELSIFHEGTYVPLTAFADVTYSSSLATITRKDSRRVVTVSAEAAAGVNSNAVLMQVQERLADFDLPVGYHLSFAGENQDQEEASAFLSEAFRIGLMLILIVLITQFTSLTTPLVIMFSVVLSLIGVFMGLLITRTPFGIIMTGVGVISLAGVVVNNAIVLLDYIIQLQARGMSKMDAIVKAGRTRFRPVILTAITTILGLIPLTTGFSVDFRRMFTGDFSRPFTIGGESSQWWGPMGTAVIWGLAVATFLTLVVVPVMYSSIDPTKRFFKRVLWELPTKPFRRGASSE